MEILTVPASYQWGLVRESTQRLAGGRCLWKMIHLALWFIHVALWELRL